MLCDVLACGNVEPFILRPGVEPERAAEVLRSLAAGARDASAAGHEWYQVRDAYLQWVENVESQLPYLTLDLAAIAAVQGVHYWRAQDSTAKFARPLPMIQAELTRQQNRFESLADELDRRRHRIAHAPGSIAVVDTHVLLHYQPPDQVLWSEVVGSSPVRLVIPLRVVEELDLKKWGDNERLSARARDLLPRLLKALGPGGAPGALRDSVTVEVPVPTRPRLRPVDADAEVLATCDELRALSGQDAVLVTGDASMTIRAEASGITVRAMPERYERKKAALSE
jgi:hypothetical protein